VDNNVFSTDGKGIDIMSAITADVCKESGSKRVTYSFQVNNDAFKAIYLPGKKSTLEIIHNDTSLGEIDTPNKKCEYTIDSETTPLTVKAWIDDRVSTATYLGKPKGVGVEVNGRPVQHTVADPETHIKIGRAALGGLSILLTIKSALSYYILFNAFGSHYVALIGNTVYFVPLLLTLLITIKYKSWPTFSIITGIVISVLDMVDFLSAIPQTINSGRGGSFVVWIFIRIGIIYSLCVAFKWRRKQRKAEGEKGTLIDTRYINNDNSNCNK
jgi:hypothetical protein